MKVKYILNYVSAYFYKRDKRIWVFSEWFGKRCGDSCAVFANYIVNTRDDIKVYWLTEEGTNTSILDEKINKCIMESPEATEVLKKAGVYVMSHGINSFTRSGINVSGKALKVNLWHGIMWKKLGFDEFPNNNLFKRISVLWSYLSSFNYLYEAPSEIYKEHMQSAYAINSKRFVNAGQPRNAIFFSEDDIGKARETIVTDLQKYLSIPITDETKIITYMPTFRDGSTEMFSFDDVQDTQRLNKVLEYNNAIIVQKAHFVASKDNNNVANSNNRIITNNILPSQQLLAATDMLITDYSSCFFDYILKDGPVIHYMYDYDYYMNENRGLYHPYQDVVCGDVAFTESELLDFMQQNLSSPGKYSELRSKRVKKYMTYEADNSCEIIASDIYKRLKI